METILGFLFNEKSTWAWFILLIIGIIYISVKLSNIFFKLAQHKEELENYKEQLNSQNVKFDNQNVKLEKIGEISVLSMKVENTKEQLDFQNIKLDIQNIKLEKINEIPVLSIKVENHKEQLGEHKEKFSKLDEINPRLVKIETILELLLANNRNPKNKKNFTVEAQSPLAITDFGRKLSNELKLEELSIKYYNDFKNIILENKLANAYDVQQFSLETINSTFEKIISEKEVNILKDKAFIEGIRVQEILFIVSILIRDKILEELKLFPEDIDKYDPSKK